MIAPIRDSIYAVKPAMSCVCVQVAVMMFRLRHKRVQDSSDMLSFDNDAQVLFKNGPLDSESVELKVPMEDDKDPVDT